MYSLLQSCLWVAYLYADTYPSSYISCAVIRVLRVCKFTISKQHRTPFLPSLAKPMAVSANSILQIIVLFFEIVFVVVGLFFVGIGLYVILGDFGDVEQSFFEGSGVIIVLLGAVITLSGIMGMNGTTNQMATYGKRCH